MRTALILVSVALVAGCERGGTSTAEIREAAINYARQEMQLPADAPLEAKVWVGQQQHQDQTVLCGTVSDPSAGAGVAPKRFAATGDPINWLIFEDAHDPMVTSQPNKFPEWQRLCGVGGNS